MNGHFSCELPNKILFWTSANVFVARVPVIPYDLYCTVFNFTWTNCDWLPNKKVQNNHTRLKTVLYTLILSRLNESDALFCSNTNRSKCSFIQQFSNNFEMDEFCIIVKADNILNKPVYSDKTCFFSKEIVALEPSKKNNFQEIQVNVYNITWHKPFTPVLSMLCVIYAINITTHRQIKIENKINFTNNPSMLLNATPFTTYNIIVNPILENCSQNLNNSKEGQKLIGDSLIYNFTSSPTVPCSQPVVHPYAFNYYYDNFNGNQLFIYWKPVNKIDYCGKNFSYDIIDAHGSLIANVDNNTIKYDLLKAHILCEDNNDNFCRIAVVSRNSIGTLKQPLTFINVVFKAKNNEIYDDNLIIIVENYNVVFKWIETAPLNNHGNVTLFWCPSDYKYTHCIGLLNWVEVNKLKGHVLKMSNISDYLFGTGNSEYGITWNKQKFFANSDILPIIDIALHFVAANSIIVECQFKKCASCAFPKYLHIFYCTTSMSNPSNCTESPSSLLTSYNSTMYKFDNLLDNTNYLFWVVFVSTYGDKSTPSFYKNIFIPKLAKGTFKMVYISLFLIIFFFFAIFGTILCFKHKTRMFKNNKMKISLPLIINQIADSRINREKEELCKRHNSTITADSGIDANSPYLTIQEIIDFEQTQKSISSFIFNNSSRSPLIDFSIAISNDYPKHGDAIHHISHYLKKDVQSDLDTDSNFDSDIFKESYLKLNEISKNHSISINSDSDYIETHRQSSGYLAHEAILNINPINGSTSTDYVRHNLVDKNGKHLHHNNQQNFDMTFSNDILKKCNSSLQSLNHIQNIDEDPKNGLHIDFDDDYKGVRNDIFLSKEDNFPENNGNFTTSSDKMMNSDYVDLASLLPQNI